MAYLCPLVATPLTLPVVYLCRFRSIAKSYFRRADGVLLLYDVTYERSFINVRDWLEAIEVSITEFYL